jgi:phosphatidylglycerol:prolipoprotein diacylglycerol transferase
VVPTTEHVHPTPLYELVLYVVTFIVLWRQRGRGLPAGHIFGQYLIYTGAARFLVEFVRRNPAWLLGFTTAQWFSIASVALGLYVLRRVGAVTSAAWRPASSA